MSMERVKEIEECIEWAKNHLVNPPANLETEDIQFLIDTVKQQSEQIEELKDLHHTQDKAISENALKIEQKDQRIDEYKQTTANQYQYIKELRDIFEEIKGEEEFAGGRVYELAEKALNK